MNHTTSGNISFHAKSSWRLKGLTEGVVTIEAGRLFQSLTNHIKMGVFLRSRRLGASRALKG